MFGIHFLHIFQCGFFTIGLQKILDHYHLKDGGWFQLLYVGGPVFSVKVMNIMLKEVVNPNAASFLDFPYWPKEGCSTFLFYAFHLCILCSLFFADVWLLNVIFQFQKYEFISLLVLLSILSKWTTWHTQLQFLFH